jgi:hypothetical protein
MNPIHSTTIEASETARAATGCLSCEIRWNVTATASTKPYLQSRFMSAGKLDSETKP